MDLRGLDVEGKHIYCFLSILMFRAILDSNAETASMKGNVLVGSLEHGQENGMARTGLGLCLERAAGKIREHPFPESPVKKGLQGGQAVHCIECT